MRNRPQIYLLIGILTFATAFAAAAEPAPVLLKSPDRQLAIAFETMQNGQAASSGQLVYSVTFAGKPLVNHSSLSLKLEGQPSLGKDVNITGQTPSQFDQTYRLVTGKTDVVRNHYNALRIEVTQAGAAHLKMIIEARAYNDAIAFRYVVPSQSGLDSFQLVKEETHFQIAKDATVWALLLPNFRTSYEADYLKLNVSAFPTGAGLSATNLIGLPLLMHVPGVAWMAITEADLQGYSSMYLKSPGTAWSDYGFVSVLAPGDNPSVVVSGSLPHHSAWRVLMIGREPGSLLESNVITSLNPPSAIQDTSWIHAGLTSWDWWSGSLNAEGKPSYSTATMKYYVDFAAQSGFPYMLIDAGWSKPGDITQMNGTVNIPEVVRYAASKHVKVWIWMRYSEVDKQMMQAFPLYEKWGVAGLKIDFVERDDAKGIAFYYRAAREAAKCHLMLDFHGATKPSGLERTYPNVLSYEAVLGMEYNKPGMRDTPAHRVTLAFTRMLAGPMDYTPGAFDNVTRANFVAREVHPMVMGTRAQQLALYVVFLAPFQMVSDWPKDYANQPAFNFIRHCPATWSETRVLSGYPGKYIVMARRKGNDWYLGSITDWTSRQLDVPLQFLGGGRYKATIYADAADAAEHPTHVSIREETVDRTSHLTLHLAPGGGYAAQFTPIQ